MKLRYLLVSCDMHRKVKDLGLGSNLTRALCHVQCSCFRLAKAAIDLAVY